MRSPSAIVGDTRPEMHWLERTFGDALAWAANSHGNREAIVEGFGEHRVAVSFAELQRRVDIFARGLVEIGVEQGEHVALWMSDSLDWMVARWAVPLIGAILVPINTRFRQTDIHFVLKHCDAVTLIMDVAGTGGVRYVDVLAAVEPAMINQCEGDWASPVLPALRRVIGRTSRSGQTRGQTAVPSLPVSMISFDAVVRLGERFVDDGALALRTGRVGADDVAQILYTSGTTSFPKGAMVCHGALLQNNAATVARMRLGPEDRYLSCVPLFSATGTSYTLSMLIAGACIVIAERFEPALFCRLVEDERITVGFFVDTIVRDLRAFDRRDAYDLSSLRTGTGAPLSRDAFDFASNELGVHELIGVFGMSETSNAVSRGDCGDPYEKRAGTNGRPVPGVEIRIADVATGETLPTNRMGEICIRGFIIMRGYYRQPDEDGKAFDSGGWFHSGDLGEVDSEGYLIYRGRVKEMIKPGGFNVATQEIEAFLRTHGGVREAVVVGVPDDRLGEVAYAYVEREPHVDVTCEELAAYCHTHIASYKVPRHFRFVDDWPRTGSQKIRKVQLRDEACVSLAGKRTA